MQRSSSTPARADQQIGRHATVATFTFCGLRNQELGATRLRDIDLANRLLLVPDAKTRPASGASTSRQRRPQRWSRGCAPAAPGLSRQALERDTLVHLVAEPESVDLALDIPPDDTGLEL